MPAQVGRLDQVHDGSRAPTSAQRSREQPVRAPDRPWPCLVLDPVIVDRRIAIIQVACERFPALEAVVDGPRRARAIRHTLALYDQPPMQRLGDRLGAFLPYPPALIGWQPDHFLLHAIPRAEQIERLCGDLALAAYVGPCIASARVNWPLYRRLAMAKSDLFEYSPAPIDDGPGKRSRVMLNWVKAHKSPQHVN